MKRLEDLPRIADEALAGLEAGPELRSRILNGGERSMKRLEELPQIAEETLAGLKAGPELRRRILGGWETARKPRVWRYAIPAMACALVLAVTLPFALRGQAPGDPDMKHYTAGDLHVGNETASLDRAHSSLRVTQDNAASRQGIWDGDSMIRIDGRYYRRLRGVRLDRGSLGGVVAETEEYNRDMTLSPAGCTSNTLKAGTQVYAVNGMAGSLVATEVDGGLQVYQRVSFNGSALIGGETLSAVMPYRGHVVAMSLSGVGLVEGETAARLFAVLTANPSYEGAGSVTQRQVLIIELDNGAAVQMDVNGDRLSACGVWSCPEFIEAFESAVR